MQERKKFTGHKELTCNFEATRCCRNWVFSLHSFHLSYWNNLNRFHHLHCSNPFPHPLHRSRRRNCDLKQSSSSSFKLWLLERTRVCQNPLFICKLFKEFSSLYYYQQTKWPKITNHINRTEQRKLLPMRSEGAHE